jgi:hypothetical protein
MIYDKFESFRLLKPHNYLTKDAIILIKDLDI